ncbi:DUF3820 family protein [Lentiprolixibacter aurantiacus]|uniref:DUF3820 family protein n=1 Tax=Lentiprolixibacter aurantiacus TaxID=2993939 RepID=A0AAE3SNX3_9FLAO|nr:DUF3820 family protein [Lentiprolixibacter aurantiacus]MCX2720000.1 DUF3820 family protein [Lentiprolixibacter aurantiacus]
MEPVFDKEHLLKLARYKMPYGKYKGYFLSELPMPYLLWFQRKGFPKGVLGQNLREVLEIKENGLEGLLSQLREDFQP